MLPVAMGTTVATRLKLEALNAEVVRLYNAGKYMECVPVAEHMLSLVKKARGPEHPDVGTTLTTVATLYRDCGRTEDAERLFVHALSILEKALGPEHPDIGYNLNNLAGLYCRSGRTAEAELFYLRALSIAENAFGSNHREVGATLNNLALLYDNEGRAADAEQFYKHSISIREKALGPEHADVGQSLNNIAEFYRAQGRLADAEPLHMRSLSIREKTLGPEHPDVCQSLSNIAELYRGQGRLADAELLNKRSLSIREKALGPGHPDVGATLNNLALVHLDQGRYAEAERLFKRALAVVEKAFGPDHTFVGQSLDNLALLYQRQALYADAEPLMRRALSIVERARASDHPAVGYSLNNLAGVYREQGRFVEAEQLFKRALSIVEKSLGPNHPFVATALNNLAAVCRDQGRHAAAETLYQRAEEIPGWEVVDLPILFATNRRPEPITAWTSFSARQESNVANISFGKAIIRAPKTEVINRAKRFADALGQRDRVLGRQTSVTDLSVRAVERDSNGVGMIATATDRLSRSARFPGQALIFVHGYNTSFEDAVRRIAMIAFDLDFDGATFLFTWPSSAALSDYRTDRKRARVAAPFLVALLDKIGAELPDVKLHMLAHSTGGEIALSALEMFAGRTRGRTRPVFGELILAHADVDPARLGRVMSSLKKLGMGVTSYSSSIDWAMRVSRLVRFLTRTRVGANPVYIKGVDAIDITGLSGGPLALNHTVFVDNPMVFGDMNRLMATGERPPDRRTAFFVPVKTQRGTHWTYKPSGQAATHGERTKKENCR